MHEALDESGNQNKYVSYNNCWFGGSCLQLKGDRIYACPQMAYIESINKKYGTSFTYERNDYLEIDKIKHRIQIYIYRLFPRPFCRYCDRKSVKTEEWAQSEMKKEEWIKQ